LAGKLPGFGSHATVGKHFGEAACLKGQCGPCHVVEFYLAFVLHPRKNCGKNLVKVAITSMSVRVRYMLYRTLGSEYVTT
jgi:hypothetical protein